MYEHHCARMRVPTQGRPDGTCVRVPRSTAAGDSAAEPARLPARHMRTGTRARVSAAASATFKFIPPVTSSALLLNTGVPAATASTSSVSSPSSLITANRVALQQPSGATTISRTSRAPACSGGRSKTPSTFVKKTARVGFSRVLKSLTMVSPDRMATPCDVSKTTS